MFRTLSLNVVAATHHETTVHTTLSAIWPTMTKCSGLSRICASAVSFIRPKLNRYRAVLMWKVDGEMGGTGVEICRFSATHDLPRNELM